MILLLLVLIFLLFMFKKTCESYMIVKCNKTNLPTEIYKYQQQSKNSSYGFIPRSLYPDIVNLNNNYSKDLRNDFKNAGGISLFNDVEKEGGCKYIHLIKDGKIVNNNSKFQTTLNLIKDIKNLRHASISCLEPKTKTDMHNKFDKYLYRAHIPLYIPNKHSGICVEKECRTWKVNDFLLVDESLMHQVWNNSSKYRVILLLDVVKVKFNKN